MLRIQAEFDNYRKRMTTALGDARQDGFMDAIEKFLPALDSFKMATEYIQDKNTTLEELCKEYDVTIIYKYSKIYEIKYDGGVSAKRSFLWDLSGIYSVLIRELV